MNIFGTEGASRSTFRSTPRPIGRARCATRRHGEIDEIALPVCDQYTIQGDLFARAVLDDLPVPTPIEDAVANMRVIEAVIASGQQGGWVEP